MAAFPGASAPAAVGENMTDIVRADGHMWLKYGQKNIHNTSIIRCYFKCYSSKNKPACRAKKTVDYDRRLPISSATTQTKYTNRSHNHSIPLNCDGSSDALGQGPYPSNAAHSSSAVALECAPSSANSSSCNLTAVVTTNSSLTSPPSRAGIRPEPSALASSSVLTRAKFPIRPTISGGVISSSVEADPAWSDSPLDDAAAATIAANLLPQSVAFTSSSESAAATPPSPAMPPSLPFNSCGSASESGSLSHFFAENDSLGGHSLCAEKRVRLTPSDEAASTENASNSAGEPWPTSSRIFEALSADLDQRFHPEACSPPTADAAARDNSFGLPVKGFSFEDGLAAASPEEARPRGLAHADISFEDFLSDLSPELCSDNFWCEEPPWLEAADVSPPWGSSGLSAGSSSVDSQEPHSIGLKRSASAMLTGATEAGILDESNPGHACAPWPMPKSSSAHSVFSFLGGGDTLSRSFLTDLHVNTIAASLPNLRALNLDTPADITAACVEHVASTLPHLTALSLWSDAVTWESAALLLALLPSLQRLSLVSGALVPRASPQPGRAEAGAAAARDTSANAAAGAEAAGSDDALSLFSSLSLAPPSAGDLFWCPSGSSLAPCRASLRLYLSPHRSVAWDQPPASSLLLALASGCHATSAEKDTNSTSGGGSGGGGSGGGSSGSGRSSSSGSSGSGSGASLCVPRPSSSSLRSFHAHNSPASTWLAVSHLFRHLTTLDLSRTEVLRSPPPPDGEPGRSEEALCRAIRGLPLLERLALPLASDAVLLEISQSCPKLTDLHAQPLARFIPVASAEGSGTNDFLYYTSSYARASVRVALPAVQWRVTDAGVLAIANGCTRLVQLSLGGCVNVRPAAWRQLARRCGRLEVLRLPRTRVDDAAVVAALFGDSWHGGVGVNGATAAGVAPGIPPGSDATAAAGRASSAPVPLQLHLPRLVLLDLFGCPGVTSALLLALSAVARELAGNDEKHRADGVAEEVERDGEGEEEKALAGEDVGHENGRKKARGYCGLQEFRLRRLLVSPEVIVGDGWRGSEEGGSEGVLGDGGGNCGGRGSSDYVDLRLVAREAPSELMGAQ
ncbi:unnamed protein product [Closterium sp. NIES-64]|nr:unnamed protein product [Closterium sp. NIES-64]